MLEVPKVRIVIGTHVYANITTSTRDMSVLLPSSKNAGTGILNAAADLRKKAEKLINDANFIEGAVHAMSLNERKSLGCEFRTMTLKQAGRHLLRRVVGLPGPFDHLRVARLCAMHETIEEVEKVACESHEHAIDVDNALESIRNLMAGRTYPLSTADAREIDDEANTASAAA